MPVVSEGEWTAGKAARRRPVGLVVAALLPLVVLAASLLPVDLSVGRYRLIAGARWGDDVEGSSSPQGFDWHPINDPDARGWWATVRAGQVIYQADWLHHNYRRPGN